MGVEAAPDTTNEPQAFEKIFWQIMVYRKVTFRHIIYKKLYRIQVFDVRIEKPK